MDLFYSKEYGYDETQCAHWMWDPCIKCIRSCIALACKRKGHIIVEPNGKMDFMSFYGYILILHLFCCKTFSYVKSFHLKTFARKLNICFSYVWLYSLETFFWCLVHRNTFSYLITYRIGANTIGSKQSCPFRAIEYH